MVDTEVLSLNLSFPFSRTLCAGSQQHDITHPIDSLVDAPVLVRGVDGSLGRKQQVAHETPADLHVLAPVAGAVHIVREDGLDGAAF